VVALLWAVPGGGFAQAPATGPQDPVTVDAARLYAAACATCHGRLGDGAGRSARLLGLPPPRDFTRGLFKLQSTPNGSVPRDEDLYRTISRGIPGTWMPAWEGRLLPAARWALVRYIKTFSTLLEQGEPDAPVEVPQPLGDTPDLVREGRFVYVMLQCWKCHGVRGTGNGPSAATLKDDWGARIRAADLTRGVFKNGSSPTDLYRTFLTGLSGTPMPALERDGVAFPGGPGAVPAGLRARFSSAELRALEAWIATQPTADRVGALTPAELDELAQRRLWALVYYVRSLDRHTWLRRLFRENPDFMSEAP
jgi:cytochrome c oxidase cbb3-type subunit 2